MERRSKNIHRPVLLILATSLFLVAAAGLFIFFRAETYLNKNLSRYVSEKSGGLYQLDFKDIELQFSPLSFSVSDISLNTDTAVAKTRLQNSPQSVLYTFRAGEIKIQGFDWRALAKNRSFRCSAITVVQPELELSGAKIMRVDTVQTFDNLFVELQPLFKNQLKTVAIGQIKFVDANYKIYNSAANFVQVSDAKRISVTIEKFKTDSALIFNETRFFDSEDVLISINQLHNHLGDSLHFMTIDTLAYSLKTSDIFAKGFHLFHNAKDTNRNLYDVYVPQLRLKSKSLARFSVGDSLNVQFLEFEKPKIKFFQKENSRKIDLGRLEKFNLYSLVQNQFSEIKIDTFLLKNAEMEIFRQPNDSAFQQRFSSLNVALFGFALDSLSSKNRDRLFHARDLEMDVLGYRLHLEDNQHDFSADSMFVSTLRNSVGIQNLNILPAPNSKLKSRTQVNIECRSLRIHDVDLKTLFHTRTLPTRLISVIGPKVQIQYHTEIERVKKQQEAGLLFDLVTAYMKGVYSDVVLVENGALNIENLNGQKELGYFETDFNFALSGFALDSASARQTDKFFYASGFDLQFSNYQMKLVDNLHKIDVERISILSSDRKLQIKNLSLQPITQNINQQLVDDFNRSEIFKIEVPEITMHNINLRDAFFYNKLNISSIEVLKPNIYYENFGELRQTNKKKEFSEIYPLIFSYIYDFNIGKITAPEGKFTWVNHTRNGKTTSFDNQFSARLENFRLNKNELGKQRLFFSDNFDVSVQNQSFQLSDSVHVLKAGEINISSRKSSASIKNALLYPNKQSSNYSKLPTTYQVSIPEIKMDAIDFRKAFFEGELKLAGLELSSPKFQVYSKSGFAKSLDFKKFKLPLPDFITSLNIKLLKAKNGHVSTFETSEKSYRPMSNFMIDLSVPNVVLTNNANNKAKFHYDNFIATISQFNTPLGATHKLEIGKLVFNQTEKKAQISRLNISPDYHKKTNNEFSISAPAMTFTGFDLQAALDNNHFIFETIAVVDPKINIEIRDSTKANKLELTQNLDLYPYVEPYVDKVKIGRLQLQNVDLNFNWFEKLSLDKRFNLDFKSIIIDENHHPGNLLSSEEFEFSATDFSTKSKNGLYGFYADSLVYNSKKHNTLFKNVGVKPLFGRSDFEAKAGTQTDYLTAKSGFVELLGVKENVWILENRIEAAALVVGQTELEIFRNKRLPFNEKQRPLWPQDLIKNIDVPFSFDSVSLLPSKLTYSELNDYTDQAGHIAFNDLQFKTGTLTNIETRLQQNRELEVEASAKLMDSGLLRANFKFNLMSENFAHTVQGSLQPMPLARFNPLIENSAPIKIESGLINRFDFSLDLNQSNAQGHVFFGYDDLKVTVLQTGNNENRKSKLATFWINTMVLNDENPKKGELQAVPVYYERDPQRSIINYWWKSIFAAAKEAIGIEPEE